MTKREINLEFWRPFRHMEKEVVLLFISLIIIIETIINFGLKKVLINKMEIV